MKFEKCATLQMWLQIFRWGNIFEMGDVGDIFTCLNILPIHVLLSPDFKSLNPQNISLYLSVPKLC